MQLRSIIHIKLEGHDYIALPREEFERLQAAGGNAEALSYSRNSIAHALVNARKAAGLTQVALAKRLGKSQTMVAHAENGTTRVSERYASAVLKACDHPKDWPVSKKVAEAKPRKKTK